MRYSKNQLHYQIWESSAHLVCLLIFIWATLSPNPYPIGSSKKTVIWDIPGYGTNKITEGLHGQEYIRTYNLLW